MNIVTESRQPTKSEIQILEKLLAANFTGSESLKKQLKDLKVQTYHTNDDYGSIKLIPSNENNPAETILQVPVEASAFDKDNVPIQILLHISNGLLSGLEILKLDGSNILAFPSIDSFEVKVNH
jgi:hypothetical protein